MALLLIVLYTSNKQYAFLININIILSIYILYRVRVRVRANAVLRSPGGLGGGSAPRLGLIWPYFPMFCLLPIINKFKYYIFNMCILYRFRVRVRAYAILRSPEGSWGRKRPQVRSNMALVSNVLFTLKIGL